MYDTIIILIVYDAIIIIVPIIINCVRSDHHHLCMMQLST